jgi:hypothetical protein
MSKFIRRALLALVVLFLLAFISLRGRESPSAWGQNDFRAYWGASYLLVQGERFNEHDTLFNLQQSIMGSELNAALMTWNPPWILTLFIPLTLFSFYDAALFWMFVNAFLFVWSLEAIWHMWPEDQRVPGRKLWLYAATLLFFPFWNSIAIGQIVPMLLFGFVGAIFFAEKRPFIAGMCLVLLTAKPHLVLITLPILLIDTLFRKNWRFLLGFGTTLIVLTGIGLLLRPALFIDYLTDTGSTTVIGQLPAVFLPFLFAILIGWLPLRFIGVALVPISLYVWFKHWKDTMSQDRFFHLALVSQLASLIVAPYGFTFDQILILPIVWVLLLSVMSNSNQVWRQAFVVLSLLISFGIMFILPIFQIKSIMFSIFFIPIVGVVYATIQPFKQRFTDQLIPN